MKGNLVKEYTEFVMAGHKSLYNFTFGELGECDIDCICGRCQFFKYFDIEHLLLDYDCDIETAYQMGLTYNMHYDFLPNKFCTHERFRIDPKENAYIIKNLNSMPKK